MKTIHWKMIKMKNSSYELHILRLLRQNNIYFEREKTFGDLRKGRYRYDFYLPNYRGRAILIEVDGEQHFHQVKHFQKTTLDFRKTQEHDRRKNSYALANSYVLIRIPYWEIENIKTINDLFNHKFIVRSKFHNDNIKAPSN